MDAFDFSFQPMVKREQIDAILLFQLVNRRYGRGLTVLTSDYYGFE